MLKKSIDIGMIGLGKMGGNMAQNLLSSGFPVCGFDVSDAAISKFRESGGTTRDSPAAVAADVDIMITSLPKASAVKEVYRGGDGIFQSGDPGLIVLEMSTISPDMATELAEEAATHDIDVLGAPVSGGPEESRDGTLTIMVGGRQEVFDDERTQTVLEHLGEDLYYTGDIDSGHMIKLINNVMTMGNLLLAMEAVSLGAARDIDGEVMLKVLGKSGGASNQFHKRMPRVLNRNFEAGFTIDLGKKDVGLALDTARSMDQSMITTSVVFNLFTQASRDGYGDEDISAIVKLLEENRGTTVDAENEVDEAYDGY
ncbi:hypothetical protein C2R22_24305 (plasmid) [Salinigranum rubrum]|uniref:NAD(P)-dependent oxidoreductase n=1 Tax=Salinigranum rubrum TaxID=755307 RepID=A0A2I8VRX5_9EURY|nr:NAD(P)-dependent oxidoreductase [Salinigranum rubrum]AUV84655.1 hypothetical protein C2R22_24305 [Salinigranum rubrum]